MTEPLRILVLSDGRPGHYHLSDGVAAALGRLRTVAVEHVEIRRSPLAPNRVLAPLVRSGLLAPSSLLAYGYGRGATRLPPADVVISAGGDTIAANVAAARMLGALNIFCGTLRKIPPQAFSLIVSSYEQHRDLPRHVVTLKPNRLDPGALGRPRDVPRFGAANPPKSAGLLIGGDSGLFHYTDTEWDALYAFARDVSRAWGTRWIVSTSRRTGGHAARCAAELAREESVVTEFIDYATAGPGTLARVFAKADVAVCTEDSSTMISEAVSVRLPVIGVSPARSSYKGEEAAYRRLMIANGWCRSIPIAALGLEAFAKALGEIKPMQENHIDALARLLAERLPGLIGRAAP